MPAPRTAAPIGTFTRSYGKRYADVIRLLITLMR